jgi:hypothetical protein
MKKIVALVGLAALSILPTSASSLSDLAASPSKPWAASLTLRGFYDDNVLGTRHGERDVFGIEASPNIALSWSLPQTSLAFNYTYSIKYYDRKPDPSRSEHYDQTHSFNALFDHRFSERYHLSINDSFVIGQEPDLLRAGTTYATFQRLSGDNIRNYGAINFDAQLTPQLGLQVGYNNAFYHYDDEGGAFDPETATINTTNKHGTHEGPSNSGRLDRIENTAHIDARWTVLPTTVAIIGYQYGWTDFTSDEPVDVNGVVGEFFDDANPTFKSEIRNSRSHYFYVGADHTFRPDLTGSIRVGGRFIDFYKSPNKESGVSPYAMASLKYAYRFQSYVEAGFSYNRNVSDLIYGSLVNNSLTTDAETAALWVTVNHAITPKLIGSVMGQFQNSTYNGGDFDNETERFYTIGFNLAYRFNPHFSTEVGYNFDKLDSDSNIGRSFDRNRVYIGGTASW